MDIWVCSRTKAKDYTWRTCAGCGSSEPPSLISDGYDQWKFEDCKPWYGLVSNNAGTVLYFGNLMTDREDSRGRPIFVHAALQANGEQERKELMGVIASLLLQEKELLPKWSDYLLGIFDGSDVSPRPVPSQPVAGASASAPESIGRYVYPQEDANARELIAKKLSMANLERPFVVGTTGRSGKGIFDRVCHSEGKWQVAFFSGMCNAKSELAVVKNIPKPGNTSPFPRSRPKPRKAALIVAGAILLCLLGVMRSCRNKPEQEKIPESEHETVSDVSQNKVSK